MMERESDGKGADSLRRYFWVSVVSWTVAIVSLFLWGMPQHREETKMLASHGAILVLGLVALIVGRRKLEGRQAAQKAAEESLRESEERYRELVEISDDVVYRTDARGVFTFINQVASRITGYSEKEFMGFHYKDLILPEYREEVEKFYGRQFVKKIPNTYYEFPFRAKNGDTRWVGQNAQLITKDGEIAGFQAIARDITERRRAEELLVESEQRYRSLVEDSFDGIFVQEGTKIVYANSPLYEMLGYDEGELEGKEHWIVYAPEYRELTRERAQARMRGEEPQPTYEVKLQRKDGSSFDGEITARAVTLKGVVGIQVWVRDISKRKALEAAIQESHSKYQSVVDSFDGLIYICSQNYEVEFANQRFIERTGCDPVGKKCYEALHNRDEICPWCVNEQVLRGETVRWEVLSPKDNRWYHMVNSPIIHPDGSVSKLALIQDITEQKRAEEEQDNLREQLFQAQKMEAIGTLAGGIAHDFNNLLQAISGYSELLLTNTTMEDKTVAGLNRINRAARNGAQLVKGLLALGGRLETQRKPVDLNHHVEHVKALLSRTISKNIQIETYLADDPPVINADSIQIEQVLMNLGVNARDAMPDGGRLIFETSRVKLDEVYCKSHLEVEPGDYVLLSVSDTGTGMGEQTAQRIFEPFFTTKHEEGGTGLGLAITYGIVKQHGGDIRCYSEPDRGTIFKIYFPAVEANAEVSESAYESLLPGGTETILLVDDDESLRSLGEDMLSQMGYTVITASNGEEALNLFKRDSEKISLVILDLMMPEMDGQRCLEEILKSDSAAKVLVASGYSANGLTKKTIETGAKGFVHKPYEMRRLLQTIRAVLDEE